MFSVLAVTSPWNSQLVRSQMSSVDLTESRFTRFFVKFGSLVSVVQLNMHYTVRLSPLCILE
jgi:hypothetical protein